MILYMYYTEQQFVQVKILLEFIWTERICFELVEHTKLSVQMTYRNIWFSETQSVLEDSNIVYKDISVADPDI